MSLYDVLDLTKDKILNAEEGMAGVYAVQLQRVDNRVKGVANSIGELVHSKAHMFQRDAIAEHGYAAKAADDAPQVISPAANEAALDRFLFWYTIEEKAALKEMTAEEQKGGVKKAASALDSAFRKLRAGLKEGCDLSENTTTNQVQNWNKAFNEQKEADEKDAAFRKQCERLGIDPDATGPQGVGSDTPAEGERSDIEVQMARMALTYEAIAEMDADRVGDMIAGQQRKAEQVLAELKAKVGQRIAS